MSGLLTTFSIADIVIILIVFIPWIWKGIKEIANLFKEASKRKKELTQEIRQQVEEEHETKERFEKGEERITQLEKEEKSLDARLQKTEERIKLLTESDMLQIKGDIKRCHDKAMVMQYIDSEQLDLLEHKFVVYEKEGGNSWAKKMMDDMRALPTVKRISDDY